MKIDFEQLGSQRKNSLNTTIGSVFSSSILSYSRNYQTKNKKQNPLQLVQKKGYQGRHKKRQNNLQGTKQIPTQQFSLRKSIENESVKQKFNNIKTMKQMQHFIDGMNNIQDQAQSRAFAYGINQTQNQKKDQTKNYSQKDSFYFHENKYISNYSHNYIKNGETYLNLKNKRANNNLQKAARQKRNQNADDFAQILENIKGSKIQRQQFLSKQKVQALTERLYYQSARKNQNHTNCCKKGSCKKILSTEQRHLTQNLLNFTGQPNQQKLRIQTQNSNEEKYQFINSFESLSRNKNQVSSLSQNSFSINKRNSILHNKLYNQWKILKVKRQIQKQQWYQKQTDQIKKQEEQAKKYHSYNKSMYEKKYRGFYQRLDELVNWKHKKYQFYQKFNLFESESKMIDFKNKTQNISKSNSKLIMKSKDIKSAKNGKIVIISEKNRYASNEKCKQHPTIFIREQQKANQPFKNQVSASIINYREAEFLQKLKQIFFNKKTKKIEINQKRISELQQKQFNLLFQLISDIEQKASSFKSEKQLEKHIKIFYQTLDTAQKQQLRRLQILKACQQKVMKNRHLKQKSKKRESYKFNKQNLKQFEQNSHQKSNINFKKQTLTNSKGTISNKANKYPQSNFKDYSTLNLPQQQAGLLKTDNFYHKMKENSRTRNSNFDYCSKLSEYV